MSASTEPQTATSAPARREPAAVAGLDVATAGRLTASEVSQALLVDPAIGLTEAEVRRRRAQVGPNAVASHRARLLPVLMHQLRSPLLALLFAAAVVSFFLGERSDAVIIAIILALSVGLGLANEYRAEKAAEALHGQIRHTTLARRAGERRAVEVAELVPGDIVELRLGDIVPADLRLLDCVQLQCDESVLTGESLPVTKHPGPVPAATALAEQPGCALMGTVVHGGSATAVVIATGRRTQFGRIAAGLSSHQLDTEFQLGLRRFSMLLVYVAGALTTSIFAINVILHRPVLDSLLFSLAIAVGITPQLLPAVVATSLAAGSRRMSRRRVLVKRLVCIEDLGDVDTLFTDKTGTLTAGRIEYMRAVPASPSVRGQDVLLNGLLGTEQVDAVGGNALDAALWTSPASQLAQQLVGGYDRLAVLPFDHERMLVSALVRGTAGSLRLVTKGAPEAVLRRCTSVPVEAQTALAAEFEAGNRVVAVAGRDWSGPAELTPAAENHLELYGFLVFLDPPKPGAAESLRRLHRLGIEVKIVTGDNATVALRVCQELGLPSRAALTGVELADLTDQELARAIATTTVFARVSPEDKARIVRIQRHSGGGVGFLGDGVNDALALHAADVGISVDSATDVAKDAADVILLEKDLGVLADGVSEGRRIFANTIKYVLMGTSSNFGNMFSAAGASLVLSFLPMLPGQILLNNLLYDASQLAIPTDEVDADQLTKPSRWDLGFIRRFMLIFGPLSSLFDFLTFFVMLRLFHAHAAEFRSGWFVESLATQTLVIFAIRTRRVPFFRSRPSLPLALAALAVVALGALLPASPIASTLGFAPLPAAFFAAVGAMVLAYLALIELAKYLFYRVQPVVTPGRRRYSHTRHLRRRVRRFNVAASTEARLD